MNTLVSAAVAMSGVPPVRSSIIRIEVPRDESGKFDSGQPLSVTAGDLVELCFDVPVTLGMPTDFDAAVRGDGVLLDSVRDVVVLTNGHPSRGIMTIAVVLRAECVGRSIVDVVPISSEGSPLEAIAFVIDVK